MRSKVKRGNVDHFDARVWMAAITLSVTGMGVWSIIVSYNNTPLNNPQVTAILLKEPQEVRTRAWENLRDNYAIQTLGKPVTRGRLRDAIDAAEAEVGSRRPRDHMEKAGVASRSTLDTVTGPVEQAK